MFSFFNRSLIFDENFYRFFSLDLKEKPLLNFTQVQSRSVDLHWKLSDSTADRSMNHFIIYYRRVNPNDLDQDDDKNDSFNMEDYQRVLVEATFSFQVTIEMRRTDERKRFFLSLV